MLSCCCRASVRSSKGKITSNTNSSLQFFGLDIDRPHLKTSGVVMKTHENEVKQKVANADEPDNLLSVLNVTPCCLASSRAALQSDAEHEAKDSIYCTFRNL